jgi:hypothetical protein
MQDGRIIKRQDDFIFVNDGCLNYSVEKSFCHNNLSAKK